MAKIKQDLYGDGRVLYEYYEGSHIILRISGMCVKVYKPYSCKTCYNSDMVYKGPKIEISMNSTVCLNISDLHLMNDSIIKAIQILNNEGFNLIDINNWKDDYAKVSIDNVVQYNTKELKKSVKFFTPPINSIFIDKNRNTFMYLGYGYLMGKSFGKIRCDNRMKSPEIYLSLNNIDINKDITFNDTSINVNTNEYIFIDTYVGRKKAVEILKEFPSEIMVYNIKNNKYVVFREENKCFDESKRYKLYEEASKYI